VALNNPESDTAIVSIGLDAVQDKGAHTLWLDHIVAIREDNAAWQTLPQRIWSIDQETGDLVLSREAMGYMGYSLMKIHGGSKPTLMSADTDACDIGEGFIIASAAYHALLSDQSQPDSGAGRTRVASLAIEAAQEKRKLPIMTGRKVSR